MRKAPTKLSLRNIADDRDRSALQRQSHVLVSVIGNKPVAYAFEGYADAALFARTHNIDENSIMSRDAFIHLYQFTNIPVSTDEKETV